MCLDPGYALLEGSVDGRITDAFYCETLGEGSSSTAVQGSICVSTIVSHGAMNPVSDIW